MTLENAQRQHSHIKSFVSGRGHLTSSQAEAIERYFPTWGLNYQADTRLNFSKLFARSAPNWLEIGFGMGETTTQIAKNNPDVNYLGIEVYPAGVGSLLKKIQENELKNIRIIKHDAIEVMQHMIEDNSLDQIMIFFPDPWRKKKHHKRRIIRSAFVSLISQKLKQGGLLHCATDWENYANHMLEVLKAEKNLINEFKYFAPRPEYRPLTKFENRGLKLGHGVWDLIYRKTGS